MKMNMRYGNLGCEIEENEKITVNAYGIDLCEEAIIYAVCRLFAHSERLCREYTYESYVMRISKGSKKRKREHECVIPAVLAELPGMWVQVRFSVTGAGVSIYYICLRNTFPQR